MRPLLLRLRFYAGLFVGPFLLVAATTGLLYTLTPQIEEAVHTTRWPSRRWVPHRSACSTRSPPQPPRFRRGR